MVRIAVVGAGHWGPNLVRNFHEHRDSTVVWVCDSDTGRLAQVMQRYPEVRISRDATEALADPGVDAVVVATPTTTHYSLVKAALEHNKHVLVEKPLAASSTQGRELCQLAEVFGRVLMVGHVFLYNAGIRKTRQYLESGHLGNVFYISMVRTNLGPIRVDVNSAWDLAAHDISIANYWLNGPPLWASARGGSWINSGVEDAVFATLGYEGGILVHLHVSWLNPRKNREITIVGDKRMLTFDDLNLSEPLRIYDKGVSDEVVNPTFVDTFASFRASIREGDIMIPKVAMEEPLKAECEHFLECVMYGKTPITKASDALTVVATLEAIDRSISRGGAQEPVLP